MVEERHTIVGKGVELKGVAAPRAKAALKVAVARPTEAHRRDLEGVVHLASALGRPPRRDKVARVLARRVEQEDRPLKYHTQYVVVVYINWRKQLRVGDPVDEDATRASVGAGYVIDLRA